VNRAQKRSEWRARFHKEAGRERQRPPGVREEVAPFISTIEESRAKAHRSVDLRIDELVLHGFEKSTGPRIAAAFESELKALLTFGGVPGGWRRNAETEQVRAEPTRLLSRSNARWTGELIARALFNAGKRERT
jgi:hypothetical protein